MIKTTTRLQLPTAPDRPGMIVGIILVIFLAAAGFAAIGRNTRRAPVVASATPALPIILIATPVVAAAAPNTFTRATVVYASPGGDVLGAVEEGRHYGFIARSGGDWIQLSIDGTGAAWVKSGDLMGAPALSDLATPTSQPQPIIVREAVPVVGTVDNINISSNAVSTPAPVDIPSIAPPGPGYVQQGSGDGDGIYTDSGADWTQADPACDDCALSPALEREAEDR